MPVVQLRCSLKDKCLRIPFPPMPSLEQMVGAFSLAPSEVVLFPPNYAADITPESWNSVKGVCRYFISVTSTGEEASVASFYDSKIYTAERLEQISEIFMHDNVRHTDTARVGPDNQDDFILIGAGIAGGLALGGIITYETPEGIELLSHIHQIVAPS